jgi:hypothetical protein
VPIQGREHISPGVPHDPYTTDPPTSGPHYAQNTEAGFYNEAPADELLVHNLEHGHVIISYNCSQLSAEACQTLKDQIQDVMSRAGVSAITGTLKLVGTPRPTMDTTLALTAWGRIEKLDTFDRARVMAFIDTWRDGPLAPEPGAP